MTKNPYIISRPNPEAIVVFSCERADHRMVAKRSACAYFEQIFGKTEANRIMRVRHFHVDTLVDALLCAQEMASHRDATVGKTVFRTEVFVRPK
jgi:hypothetical protein